MHGKQEGDPPFSAMSWEQGSAQSDFEVTCKTLCGSADCIFFPFPIMPGEHLTSGPEAVWKMSSSALFPLPEGYL